MLVAACSTQQQPVAKPVQPSPSATPTPTPTPIPTPIPSPVTFADTYAAVTSGVVRIDEQGCDGGGSGTGFLIGPDLVATVAHVVKGSATLRITQGTRSASAEVLGLDDSSDTALIRVSRPLPGHIFHFSAQGPVVGERIGVIGFPAGDTGLVRAAAGSKSFKEGSVNGLDRKNVIEGITRTNLVELDAFARSGNSGSPVITIHGDVVGLLSAGPAEEADPTRPRLAVNSQLAQPLLGGWRSAAKVIAPADCSQVLDPSGRPAPFERQPGGDGAEVGATLNLYFRSINQADYATAYAQFHPDHQTPDGAAAFAKGVNTSADSNVTYHPLSRSGRDLVEWVTFRSTQDSAYGPAGLTCADWSLDYTLRQSDGLWLITGSGPHGAAPSYTACSGGA